MSNIFSKYEKQLSGVKVIDSSKAYVYNPKTNKNDLRISSILLREVLNRFADAVSTIVVSFFNISNQVFSGIL